MGFAGKTNFFPWSRPSWEQKACIDQHIGIHQHAARQLINVHRSLRG